MKLVIDIPKDVKEKIAIMGLDRLDVWNIRSVSKAISDGTPLDDIRKEIIEEKEFAYADFERYKVECLGQDWEDAYDSLPQDDFRYGMERCLEIINRHISGKDGE